MKQVAKRLIHTLSPGVYENIRKRRFLRRLGTRDDSYLVTSGFLKSFELGYPCRLDGSPLPWMSYGVIALLEERLTNDITLFEYGSGYSTLFYAERVKRVVSVEYNQDWYNNIRARAEPNVELIYQPLEYDGDYCRLINRQHGTFDVVIVDGRDRVRCAINSFDALSERGVIILDDSAREKYREATDFLLGKGLRKLDFHGLKPASKELGPSQTSVFYTRDNCLGI